MDFEFITQKGHCDNTYTLIDTCMNITHMPEMFCERMNLILLTVIKIKEIIPTRSQMHIFV